MKWRLLIFVVVCAGLLIWQRTTLKPEPTYNGKPLSIYVRNLYLPNKGGVGTYSETTDAFLHFGMDGAPYLAKALGKRDSVLYQSLLVKLPDGLARHLPQPLDRGDVRRVRTRAYSLLWKLGSTARSAIPQLIHLLRSNDPEVVALAAGILGRIGPDSRTAIPALITLLKTGQEADKNSAITALASIGLSAQDAMEALPLVIKQVKTNSDPVRRIKAMALLLSMAGADLSPVVPALIDALDDPESRVRAWVAKSLGHIGGGATDAVLALTETLKDEWWYVRESGAIALGKIGPASKPAIPALLLLKEHEPNKDVRKAATEAIELIQKDFAEPKTE